MRELKTLVYFDLEATGLKSSGRPRICELTLLAVKTKDVLDLNVKMKDYNMKGQYENNVFHQEILLPRIVNKLTLCIYPMATIVPLVSDMTGLDNYNLSGQSKFNKNTGDLINNFLSCLPSPVCLVAHNGNAYDFPLLKAEMENAGTQLNPEILCADSYIGIRDIFAKRAYIFEEEETRKKEVIQIEEMKIAKIEIDALAYLVKSGAFEEEMAEGISNDIVKNSGNPSSPKQANEFTPCKTKDTLASCLKPRKLKQKSYDEKFKSRKKLNFGYPSAPTSFSLINLHLHLLGYQPHKSHGAEADCLALLKTTAALGYEWMDWVKENSCMFSDCRRMWGMYYQ
jgi:three prime repair exonuclease-1